MLLAQHIGTARHHDDGDANPESCFQPHFPILPNYPLNQPAQANTSVKVFEVCIESVPQLLIGTPTACCTVRPRRVDGSPLATTWMPVFTRPPARPAVISGMLSRLWTLA